MRTDTPDCVEAPLVRLRVRRLELVRLDGVRKESSTVFCPARRCSMDVDACRHCPQFSRVTEDAIECAPPTSKCIIRDFLADARLGGDACVGDAMGYVAVLVDANLSARAIARSLKERGAIVAIVVEDMKRFAGLVDGADAARAIEPVRARELVRRIMPVHESAPLSHAVDRMVCERARALPVVDNDGDVVALLTDLDALHWVARRSVMR